MIVYRAFLIFILVCLGLGLELDPLKYERLMILPRSNKIPNVGEAADGDTETCIQYTKRPRARIWIDLRALRNVHRVIIRHSSTDSNSDLQMMKNIRIRLSNTTSASKKENCYTNYDDIPSDGAMDTTNHCVSQSIRSVYVIRPVELRFCEVEVFGCMLGRWGAECDNQCGACAGGDTCDSVTGNCPGACATGWNGFLCNKEKATTTTTTTTPSTTQTTTTTTPSTTQPITTTTTPSTTRPITTTSTTISSTTPAPTTPTTPKTTAGALSTSVQTTTQMTTKSMTVTSISGIETDGDEAVTATSDTNTSPAIPPQTTSDTVTPGSGSAAVTSGQTDQTQGVTTYSSGDDSSSTSSIDIMNHTGLNTTESFSPTISTVSYGNTEMDSTELTSTTDSMSEVPTKEDVVTATASSSMSVTVFSESASKETNDLTTGESTEVKRQTSYSNVADNTTDVSYRVPHNTTSSPSTAESSIPTTTYSDWSGDGLDDFMNDSVVITTDTDTVSSDIPLAEEITYTPETTTGMETISPTLFVTDIGTENTSQTTSAVNPPEETTKFTKGFQEVEQIYPNRKKTPTCRGFTCSKNNLVVLVGIVVSLLLISALIATIYAYRRRMRQKRNNDLEKGDSFKGFNGLPLPDITAAAKAYGSNDDIATTKMDGTPDPVEKDYSDANTALLVPCNLSSFSPSQAKSTAVGDIQDHILMMKDRALFSKDFNSLPGADVSQCTVGTEKKNSKKNRYANITTFDESRVTLVTKNDEENDFINASYIDNFEQPKAYIATQGPLKHTIDDFWRMIWQERTEEIVMLTELQENEKVKCVQYWPGENEKMSVGNLIITTEYEFHFPVYKLRTFCITDAQTSESRKVTQFQFTAWPDHGVPEAFPLILFHDRVISQHSNTAGPMVVHCSAGVGRTGTFIAMNALSDQGRQTGQVTIHLFVEYMRRCRPRMVQTIEQYVFLHTVLMEMFLCPGSLVEAESLRETWNINSDGSHTQTVREEYERLQRLRPRYGGEAYSIAHQDQNSCKNGTTVLPVNDYRVVLANEEEDYINAVTMPNLGNKPDYVVTEIPVSSSIQNFWQMIYEQRCNVIVCLDIPLDEKGVSILPETDLEKTHGAFSLRLVDTGVGSHGVQRETFMLTRDNEEQEVAVFYLPTWKTEEQLPPMCASLISLHQETQKWQENKGQCRVTVVCRDGAERCGLYCAVCNMMECIDWYNRVDIFHTVRHLQIRRPEVIQNLIQYSYCFDCSTPYRHHTNTPSDGTCIQLPNNTVFMSPTTKV
ncbi:receptor-type tyrosine-protein phosphatase T-like [Argopecten irradians]|uniref:receptor-type tyrosine-protein phosphatase T-like n=1 Tax=Argopecten irradians TaxID=31199 RepID=UPI0037219985